MALSFARSALFMDPDEPPKAFFGTADTTHSLDWYKTKSGRVNHGLNKTIRETTEGMASLYNDKEKGLSQVHRWSSKQVREKHPRSMRRVLERHGGVGAVERTLLFYNTWLVDTPLNIEGPLNINSRQNELAKALSRDAYDILGLCEVFADDRGKAIERQLHYPFESRRKPHDSGLHTIVNSSNCRITERQHKGFVHDSSGFLDVEGFKNKGLLYLEIDVGPGKIDLFTTHMHAQNARVRRGQIEEILDFVNTHQKPENVTILAGDFNVDGRTPEYNRLLKSLYGPDDVFKPFGADLRSNHSIDLKLQDVWLIRGSQLGATHQIQDFGGICKLDNQRRYCMDRETVSTPGEPTDRAPGYRLDYIFVEQPNHAQSFNLDISRVRRRPFWRGEHRSEDFPADRFTHSLELPPGVDHEIKIPNYLSDHLALELNLAVSPKR